MKKYLVCLLAIFMIVSASCGDSGKAVQAPAATEGEDAASSYEVIASGGESGESEAAPTLIGMIIDDDGSDASRMAIYGFLNTAENLSIAAKLYRAKDGAEAVSAVGEAAEDGVAGLIINSPNGANDEAVTAASDKGMYVIVPYYECTASGLDVNVVADSTEYYDELARGLAERLTERKLKSGRILIYGRDIAKGLELFSASVAANYPQFFVDGFVRTTEDDETAKAELADYILNNRDIKGMYVLDADSAVVAVGARTLAQKRFKSEGAPTPTPTPDTAPDSTPGYVPNPGLLTQITVTVFANGLSDENYGLFEDSDIYALCIEPFYEAAAQATMTLDRLISLEQAASVSKVNRPIIYSDTAEKYKAIYDKMKEMFEA